MAVVPSIHRSRLGDPVHCAPHEGLDQEVADGLVRPALRDVCQNLVEGLQLLGARRVGRDPPVLSEPLCANLSLLLPKPVTPAVPGARQAGPDRS